MYYAWCDYTSHDDSVQWITHTYAHAYTSTRARALSTTKPHRRWRQQQHPQPPERPPARRQPPSDGRDDDDGDDYDDDAAAAAGRRTVQSVSQSVYVARLRCAQTYHACQYVPRDRSLAGSSEILRTSLSLPRNSTVGPRLIVLSLSVRWPRAAHAPSTILSSSPNPRVLTNNFFPDF